MKSKEDLKMTNIEKYINAFTEALEVKEDQVEGLEYQDFGVSH